MKRLSTLVGCLAVSLALFGAGCSKNPTTTGPISIDDLNKKPPVEVTQTLQFLPGDSFGMTISGATTTVSLSRFAATNFADFSWKTASASGTVSDINLSRSHTLFPPIFWRAKGTSDLLKEKTAIWLSDDAYMELSRTRRTVLNFGVLDEVMASLVKSRKDLKPTFDLLRTKASEDGKRVDLTLMQAEATDADWPIVVNGKQITVKVIKAKNWFGEVVILDNRQNPMVLKMTLNPLFAGASEAIKDNDPMKAAFGYEVTSFNLSSIK